MDREGLEAAQGEALAGREILEAWEGMAVWGLEAIMLRPHSLLHAVAGDGAVVPDVQGAVCLDASPSYWAQEDLWRCLLWDLLLFFNTNCFKNFTVRSRRAFF